MGRIPSDVRAMNSSWSTNQNWAGPEAFTWTGKVPRGASGSMRKVPVIRSGQAKAPGPAADGGSKPWNRLKSPGMHEGSR